LAKLEEAPPTEGDTEPSKLSRAGETGISDEEIPAEAVSELSDESSAVPPAWLLAALAEQEGEEEHPVLLEESRS
jgi:hypothetical protein